MNHPLRETVAVLFLILLSAHDRIICAAQEVSDVPDQTDTSVLTANEILLKIFDRTNGFGWTSRKNWMEDDVCTYEGIACYQDSEDYAGHIREVDLADNGLVGTMPAELFRLPYLETVILRDNADLYVQFDNLHEAQHLKHLVVSGTHTDTLEGIQGGASSLETLHITNLGLTGPIPSALFQLTNLRGLFANFNSFTGALSTEIGNLFFLTDLYLFENDLEGPIPTEIGKLVNLQTLSLGENAWSGELPTELDLLTDLRTLAIQRSVDNLKGPGLSGNVLDLSTMPDINSVDLSNQRLSGSIPNNFLEAASEDKPLQVNLRGNQISGEIPNSLISKARLSFYLAGNQISGLAPDFCNQVPQWMGGAVASIGCDAILCPPGTYNPVGRKEHGQDTCNTCVTNTFFGATSCAAPVNSGQFERETLIKFFDSMGGQYWKTATNWLSPASDVCGWFGVSCNANGQVIAIRLRNNDLTMAPPTDIFNLPELRVLDLAENTLDFSFSGIENAAKLQLLDLTQTDLKSLDGIEGLQQTQIKTLALGSNILNGAVPSVIFSLSNLEELDLSHNFLQGQLPGLVGNLISLRRLYLFGNAFTGQLPTELGQLNQLVELKAGENSFSGSLPLQLNNLEDLEILSLHQTTTSGAISGNLPAYDGLRKLSSLHLAGNALAGTLPPSFLANTLRGNEQIEILLGDNLLSGEIPSVWAERFGNLVLDLTGNLITSFGSGICDSTGWMNGNVGLYGCNAILCPSGTYNEFGRQSTSEGICRNCNQANVLGAKVCGTAPVTPAGEEIDYLQDLFDATHGNSWSRSDGWKSTSDYCSWFGISCNSSGRVTKISLPDNNLSGTPPSSIFNLDSLKELDLSRNQITFSFQGIEAATALNKLVLSSTNLNSVTGLDSARNLLELEMDDNDIGGTLPAEFWALTGLRRLSLSFNNIEGRIPADVSSLKSLEEMSLFHNRLTGQLPAAIGTLSNLRVLALSENNFYGSIPPSFNNLVKLETLAIQREGGGVDGSPQSIGVNPGPSDDEGAGLSGPLPAFDKLSNLRQLFLGVNSFTGNIPSNFLGGVIDENAEIVVDLTSNRLSGGIPGALARFEKLTIFLAGNRLTEDIPSGICRQTGWMNGQVGTLGCEAILCSRNHVAQYGRRTDSSECVPCDSGESTLFLGSFECQASHTSSLEFDVLQELFKQTNGDAWIRNDYWLDPDVSICSWYGITCDAGSGESVVSIQLVQNGLTGRVPTSIFELANLRELSLAENDADMSFAGIGSAQNLEYLDVNSMSLSSLAGLGQARGLLQLHAASNRLGPTFPAEIIPLTNIEVLDLSFNPLGENIPTEASDWTNLRSFSCEKCGFVGFIPPVIGSWTQLKYLNLADNDYNGVFPIEVESLANLEYLDVSKQKSENSFGLSGFLPSFNSAPNLQEVYLQENDFFGEIPANFLASTNTEDIVVDVRQNRLNGTIPFGLQRFSDGVFLFADNQLGGVPGPLCSLGWNDQPAGNSECDFVLCPVGTYNGIGRATATLPCTPCASAIYWGTTGCGNIEREVLRELFYGMEGSQWLHNDGWGSHTSICEWYGVNCYTEGVHTGLVQKLDLRGNNIVGTLDTSIWQLTAMTELDLSDNNIHVESFQGIEDATMLETLKLSNNQVNTLDGIHMASTTLRNFHCTSCEIYGPFPEEFFTLSNLERLYLNYNYLSGPISGLKDMANLVEIYLFSNELTGELPFPQIGSRFVEVISIGHNRLNGTIPATYNVLPALRVFSAEHEGSSTLPVDEEFGFKDNGLIGTVPSFAFCPALREVYLSGNGLGGQIPQDFLQSVTEVGAPIHIDISNNFISGTIPSGLAKFDDMRLLASNNQIQAVPPSICDKTAWMDGLLASGCDALLCPKGTFSEVGRRTSSSSCKPCDYRGAAVFMGTTKCGPLDPNMPERDVLVEFFGTAEGLVWKDNTGWNTTAPICQWFGVTCEKIAGEDSVTEISLPSNGLSNRIGSIVFSLPNLRALDISDNLVDMTFRDAFRATRLEELDVSNTGVSSATGIGGAKSLQKLVLARNIFTGQEIPSEIYSLTKLTHLDLSYSGFMGTISEDLSQLSALLYLDLSFNDLAGSIPTSVGSLAKLQRLDMSENLLHGELPSSLNGLSSLESLYLGARTRPTVGLSGQLPTFDGFRKLRYIDLGANSLTGTVPPDLLAGLDSFSEQVTVLLDSNILHGTIPIGLNRFSRLSIDLADNEIEGIASGLCSMTLWWDGDVANHQCDAILCPPGTFNAVGRQDSPDNRCNECPGSGGDQFYGRIMCPSLQKAASKKILEDLYIATGGSSWKRRNNWLTHPDICVWEGITCSNDGVGVETVNLGSNNLSGRPPKEIFDLLGLKNLWLFSNPIDFSFEGIGNAQTLVNLQLDSVGLRNLDGIGDAPSLTYLDVRFNALEGVISSEIDKLSSLLTLLISDNSLYGPLPSFSSNRRLTTLKAGGNAFTGPLPSFSVHPNLRQLDVTGNQLNGEIPNDLLVNVDSSTPVLLYLSSNKFSGILPSTLARFDDLTIFVNDNEITGIASDLCEKDKWNGGDVERFGCDGILCPPRSYAPKGRASSDSGDCVVCDSASFFGHSVCVSSDGLSNHWSWYSTMALMVVPTVLVFMY